MDDDDDDGVIAERLQNKQWRAAIYFLCKVCETVSYGLMLREGMFGQYVFNNWKPTSECGNWRS